MFCPIRSTLFAPAQARKHLYLRKLSYLAIMERETSFISNRVRWITILIGISVAYAAALVYTQL